MRKLKRLIVEIHQRSVWQAVVVYLGASYAVLETVDLFIDRFGLPVWLFPVAFLLLLVGLPLVVVSPLAREGVFDDEVLLEATEAAAKEDARLRFLTWRTAGQAFVGALAVWGVIVTGYLLSSKAGGEAVDAAIEPAHRVVVLPFTYRGSEEWAYLGEGMVDLLSKTLDGAGELTDRSVYYYGKLIDLWEDADAELQPRVDAARRPIQDQSTDT